jgi:hypothetical protein
MKRLFLKTISVALIFGMVLAGCGDDLRIGNKLYTTKGLITLHEMDDDIEYRIIVGNFVWGIILLETVVFPIYFFGFSLWEPVGLKNCDDSMRPLQGTVSHS